MHFITREQIEELLTGAHSAPKRHFIADCPYCGKSGHFYIKHTNTDTRPGYDNTGVHDCKKCGEAGGIFRFLNQVGREDLIYRDVNIATLTPYIQHLDEQVAEPPLQLDVPPRGWPLGFEPIQTSKYLIRRCFRPKDFREGTIGRVRLESKLRKYILIGVTEYGVVKGFVGRCLSNDPELLRYRNSSNTNFASLLWGFDELTPATTRVFLVEGLFDAKRINRELKRMGITDAKAVATFGKKVSRVQIAKLLLKGIREVVVFYDNDAVPQSRQYANELSDYFPTVVLAYLPGKADSADADVETLRTSLTQLYTPTQFQLNCLTRFKL